MGYPGQSLMIDGGMDSSLPQPIYQDSVPPLEIQGPGSSMPSVELAPELQPTSYVPGVPNGVSPAGYQSVGGQYNPNVRR